MSVDTQLTIHCEELRDDLGPVGSPVRYALFCAILMCLSTTGVSRAGEMSPKPVHALDAVGIDRVLALDCGHVTPTDVAQLLARAPAPRIILFQGSVAMVTMEPFADFLIAMGYPEGRIRAPRDGRMSQSSFGDSLAWAGTLAWYYETEGMMPMLVGHSQGGMMTIRILYELNGAFHDSIPVWNPLTGAALPRTTIRDPRSGDTRAVVGLPWTMQRRWRRASCREYSWVNGT